MKTSHTSSTTKESISNIKQLTKVVNKWEEIYNSLPVRIETNHLEEHQELIAKFHEVGERYKKSDHVCNITKGYLRVCDNIVNDEIPKYRRVTPNVLEVNDDLLSRLGKFIKEEREDPILYLRTDNPKTINMFIRNNKDLNYERLEDKRILGKIRLDNGNVKYHCKFGDAIVVI